MVLNLDRRKMSNLVTHNAETTHPLLMDPVLQILFNFLEVRDVKNCRFVTQEWAAKAFHTLRGRTVIHLDSNSKVKSFFTSSRELNQMSPSQRFLGFSFDIVCWNGAVSQYIGTVGAKDLAVHYDLTLSQKSFDTFQDILLSQSRKLVKMSVNVEVRSIHQAEVNADQLLTVFLVPETLKHIEYPFLKSLTVKYISNEDPVSSKGMSDLWMQIIKYSPSLKHLSIALEDSGFWSDLNSFPKLWKLERLESLTLPFITPEITHIISRIPQLNLKILELKFIPGGVDRILQRAAESLEILNFFTPNESALSPVNFPVMPKLKILNSGNSQLSFPSITVGQLPMLEELQVTYWDWVWTFEELPDGHYYWRTDEPHPKVTRLVIRFPPLVDVTGNYSVMENFIDFCNRIAEKFPSLQTIRLKNLCNNALDNFLPGTFKVGDIVRSIGTRLTEISVVDYCKETASNSSDLLSAVDGTTCLCLETLDLNPSDWLRIWKGDELGQLEFMDWSLNIHPIPNLKVAKLIWVFNLKLTVLVQKLPELVHLEIVGGNCIDRFDRYEMRKLRPSLAFVQHDCRCSKEDAWYMHDSCSHQVFHRLFNTEAENKSEAFLKRLSSNYISVEDFFSELL